MSNLLFDIYFNNHRQLKRKEEIEMRWRVLDNKQINITCRYMYLKMLMRKIRCNFRLRNFF